MDINWDWLNSLPPAEQAFVDMSNPKGFDQSSERIWDGPLKYMKGPTGNVKRWDSATQTWTCKCKWNGGYSVSVSPNISVAIPPIKHGENYVITTNDGYVRIGEEHPKLHYTLPPRISTRRKHLGQIALAFMLASWVLYAVFTFGR